MIAPNNVVFTTEPHRSVVDALFSSVAKKGPSGASKDRVARIPPVSPKMIANTLNNPVTIISARKRGTTRFLIGSTPSTWRASSSSRILRAPRSTVIAVPPTPARMIAVTSGRERGSRRAEEAAEPVDGAEQNQEVARLKPRRAIAHREHRDRQGHPAEAQHEEELLHELGAVRIRRPDRGDERLAGQDHHVADLVEQVLGRQEHPICGGSDHSDQVCYHSASTFATQCGTMPACRATSISASTAGPVPRLVLSWPAASGRRSRTAPLSLGTDSQASGSLPTSRA